MPRFNIRKSRGPGTLVGSGYVEPYARRLAARLAEMHGESLVLLDTWTRRRIRGYEPSKHAVAQRVAREEAAKSRLTSAGLDGAMTGRLFFGVPRRPTAPTPLSDRAENPETLPLRPTLPDDLLLDV